MRDKYTISCTMCNQEFKTSCSWQKTCSLECRKKRLGIYQDTSIPANTVGAISELMVSADLMKKGYSVFRTLSPQCFCDIIAIKEKDFLRVEIRTGYMGNNGVIVYPKRKNGEIDIFGVYERNLDKCFYFDLNNKEIKF